MPLIKARSSSIMESVDLRGTPTTATATAATNTTQVASTAFVKTNIANLINSAPEALDTLNELALALNSDSSFSSTITTALAAKLALAGGTMTGLITLSGAPTSGLHATTKTYVDAGIAAITLTNSDGLTEGSTNLYFTNARARGAISLSGNNADVLAYNSSTGTLTFAWPTTDGVSEGSNNLFHTTARVRTNISLTTSDSGLLGYNSTTGVFTFANPDTDDVAEGANLYHTTARARAAISAGTNIAYDSATGVISSTSAVSSVNGATGVVSLDTDDVTEGSTNLYATNARARGAISLTTSDSSVLAYDSGTGVITFTKPTTDGITEGSTNLYHTTARARAAITVSGDLTYAAGVVGFALSNHDTDDVAEGSTNLYATNARARAAITLTTDSAALAYNGSTGVLTYSKPDSDAVAEGATNQYFTNARVRAAVSVTDAGGDGSMTYNSSTGVFTYTGPSASEVRAHVSATTSGTGHGSLSVTAGEFTFAKVTAANIRGELSAGTGVSYDSTTGIISANASDLDTDDIAEAESGATNLYFTNTRARAAVSATDAGGDGSFVYDSATGAFTYTGPSAAEARVHVSVTDAGGDGSLSYNSSTGVFTYTGPSASEVRAHFSATAATGVTVTAGVIALASIPNSSLTNSGITINGTSVELGGTRTLDTDSVDEGSTNLYHTTARARAAITVSGDLTYAAGVVGFALSNHDTADLAEGTNLYFTNTRARSAVSLTTDDTAVLAYNSSTGVLTFAIAGVNTDKVVEGATNLYHTTARARTSISVAGSGSYDSSTGVITVNGAVTSVNGATGVVSLDTDDVTEGSTNLYATNARARSAISLTTDGAALAYNSGTGVFTYAKPNTDAVAEGSTNLYFTNARADGRIAAASIADLADVGSIGSIIDGYALVWSATTSTFVPQNVATTATSVTFTGDGSTLSFSTGVEVLSIQNTQVFINGLVQAPTYSYTLSTTDSVTSVVFDTAPETSDYIFIRVTSISALTGDGILNEDSTIDGGSY